MFALTNWSDELFPHALARFDFLALFDDIVVSGAEGLAKPDPAIFERAARADRPAAGDAASSSTTRRPTSPPPPRAGLDAIRFTGDARCGLSCGRAACRSEARRRRARRRAPRQRGPLDLQQRDALPLRLERRLAAADPEQPLGPEQVDHREDVERERDDPQPGDRLDDLVDLERDEDAGADHRDVLAPALHQPEADRLDELQDAVRQHAGRTISSVECWAFSAFSISRTGPADSRSTPSRSATGRSSGR